MADIACPHAPLEQRNRKNKHSKKKKMCSERHGKLEIWKKQKQKRKVENQ